MQISWWKPVASPFCADVIHSAYRLLSLLVGDPIAQFVDLKM